MIYNCHKIREYVELRLEVEEDQFLDDVLARVANEAEAILCDAIDGKGEDYDYVGCIPTTIYPSYDDEGLAEFYLKEAVAVENGWKVTYIFNSTIK